MKRLRQAWRGWWTARLPRTDTLALNQRNLYILPTRGGWLFALTLLTLLLAAINYQLSLGYALTFLLAGSGLASMHLTHATLRGLTLRLRPPEPVFAGEPALLELVLHSEARRTRHGIGLATLDDSAAAPRWVHLDLEAGGHGQVQLAVLGTARGWQTLPPIVLESRFPLGLFRVWSIWRPASRLLVYPAPETRGPPLAPGRADTTQHASSTRLSGEETDGVRPWRRGDPAHAIAWKVSARALAAGGEPIVRDARAPSRAVVWIDWSDAAPLAPEDRLRRLTHWLLLAERAQLRWGLRLPNRSLAPDQGEPHRRQALEHLACWPAAPGAGGTEGPQR